MFLSYYEFDLVYYLIKFILEEFVGKRIYDFFENGLVWYFFKIGMWGVRIGWEERLFYLKIIVLFLL